MGAALVFRLIRPYDIRPRRSVWARFNVLSPLPSDPTVIPATAGIHQRAMGPGQRHAGMTDREAFAAMTHMVREVCSRRILRRVQDSLALAPNARSLREPVLPSGYRGVR